MRMVVAVMVVLMVVTVVMVAVVVIIAVVVASDRTNFRVVLKALHREVVRLPFRSIYL